jgi:vacuolar-type H+-ATPase subunit D/Vma8
MEQKGGIPMPIIYLSPSTQENNLYVNGGTEEEWMNRLADAIKKTQKRANALQNIVIPGLDGTIRFITDALEEKEREEFARLKVIKRVTTKQK